MLPIDATWEQDGLPQKTYPFEIKPRTKESFYISEVAKFHEQMAGIKREQGNVRFLLKTATVSSGDGLTLRAKGDRGILRFSRSRE